MRTTGNLLLGGALIAASIATAQGPGPGGPPPRGGGPGGAEDPVARMMEFDKDKDGKLAKAEVTDARLHRLFDRADADKDGSVTKAELTALAAKEQADDRGFGGPGGPGGFGGPGGPGGPGGMMGMARPGEVLSTMVQQRLALSPEQKTKVEAFQKEVDSGLAKILDDEQQKQLKAMRERGPGGPGGGPGGRGRPPGGGPGGGPGGPGGPPPGRDRPE